MPGSIRHHTATRERKIDPFGGLSSRDVERPGRFERLFLSERKRDIARAPHVDEIAARRELGEFKAAICICLRVSVDARSDDMHVNEPQWTACFGRHDAPLNARSSRLLCRHIARRQGWSLRKHATNQRRDK